MTISCGSGLIPTRGLCPYREGQDAGAYSGTDRAANATCVTPSHRIDLVYYGNQRHLEYDLVVAPGADPTHITLGLEGADTVAIDAQEDLVLHTPGGEVHLHQPRVYM